jgi:membrane-associated phospholipid phosphatase
VTNRLLLLISLLVSTLAVQGHVASEWNQTILGSIRQQTPAPLLLVRNLSIVHRCMYDAVLICDPNSTRFTPTLPVEQLDNANEQPPPALTASFAAQKAASILFPSTRPALKKHLEQECTGYDTKTIQSARNLGYRIAITHLENRENDGITANITYVPRSSPGQWRRTPPAYRPPEMPHGRNVRTYILTNLENYLPPGPPALDSPSYASALNHVLQLGAKASPVRTKDQSVIARFWSDFSYTITPPGHWNQIACRIAEDRGLSIVEEAHLLAWLNTAMLDAGVVCWEAKYRFNFWRPITATINAERDNNDATVADPNWLSYLESPPHPEYPSGHSSFSGAAARFLQLYFGVDEVDFKVTSDSVPDHVRTYSSLWDCAEEVSWSRIYGGIHYLFSGDDGLASGKIVAEAVFTASGR